MYQFGYMQNLSISVAETLQLYWAQTFNTCPSVHIKEKIKEILLFFNQYQGCYYIKGKLLSIYCIIIVFPCH